VNNGARIFGTLDTYCAYYVNSGDILTENVPLLVINKDTLFYFSVVGLFV